MPAGDQPQISAVLRQAREQTGLSVRQLAERSGIAPSTISRLEMGEVATPSPVHLQRLAAELGIEVEEFYAAAGYATPTGLPALHTYLRAKFGIAEDDAHQIEDYVQAVRDRNQPTPRKEENNDNDRRDQTP